MSTTIRVTKDTLEDLKALSGSGESLSDVIQRLISICYHVSRIRNLLGKSPGLFELWKKEALKYDDE